LINGIKPLSDHFKNFFIAQELRKHGLRLLIFDLQNIIDTITLMKTLKKY